MDHDFYAYMGRMKYIRRWALMHSTVDENIMEHSWEVAEIAHALALIENEMFGGKVDLYRTLCYAVYHEASEVVTGDLPTPIKYFNEHIRSAYKDLEALSCRKLVDKLPEELRESYASFIFPDEKSIEYRLMKCADRFAAYVKCVEEVKSGNREFVKAKETIGEDIEGMQEKSCVYFRENILPSFEKTLDELDR